MKKSSSPQQGPAGRDYRAGNIYSFRTSPTTEFSAKEFTRYAALKVLGLKDGRVCYVVLDGVFERPPDLAQTSNLPWLRRTRFLFRGDPAWHFTPVDWENDLEDFCYVGNVELSPEDIDLMAAYRGYGTWSGANHDAEGEWRWRNDRTAYKDEVECAERARDARMIAERERYQKRLETLIWEKLLEEEPFSRWNVHPPFPPPEFVAAARDRIRSTILELQGIGAHMKKAQVRSALKACVEWFNMKDAEFGHVIETEEREDICMLLRELVFVAGHQSLVDEGSVLT